MTALIVVGGSAGGLEAIEEMMRPLPSDFPVPIVVVLHLRNGPSKDYLAYFHRLKLKVCEAEEKTLPQPGCFYVAPPGYHLLLERDGSFALSIDELVNWARPSIDVFFESAADAIGNRIAGIIVSGANDDGATGLAAIKAVGGVCLVQDPEEAEIGMMPKAAMERASVQKTMKIAEIGKWLLELGETQRKQVYR